MELSEVSQANLSGVRGAFDSDIGVG